MKLFGWWKNASREFRQFLIGAYVVYALASIVAAAVETTDMRSQEKTGCVYKSLASLTNIPFALTCEMFRERFVLEPGKKK